MGPEQRQARARLDPESAGLSDQPVSADDRLATLIQGNQEEIVDELASDLWGFEVHGCAAPIQLKRRCDCSWRHL